MDQETKSGNFTVKFYGEVNPLIIKFPQNEITGNKNMIDLELAAFYWMTNMGLDETIYPILARIPGLASGNYTVDGMNTDVTTMIMPDDVVSVFDRSGIITGWYSHYTYTPGRPDLYILPPSPAIQVEFLWPDGSYVDFKGNPYFVSFNFGS